MNKPFYVHESAIMDENVKEQKTGKVWERL